MSLAMSRAECEVFLTELRVGVISIAQSGRGPLTAPIWYDYEPGGELWVLISPESRKGKLIDAGTRISLVAQQEALPYRYVSVEGPVTRITDSSDAELLAMASRYLGPEQGAAYVANSSGANVTVRMRPERWLSVDYGKSGS